MLKRIVAAAFLATLCSSVASALGVAYSKHNLSVTGTGVHSTTEDQICSFCHRPHGSLGEPLWGRVFPPLDSFSLCSSDSMSPSATAAVLDDGSESALCLSCHAATLEELGPDMVDPNGTWGTSRLAWFGTCLANHPIGFDYESAQAEKPTKLRPIAEVTAALGSGVFFRSSAVSTYTVMECGTCHKVHDNAIPPFLRKSNVDSGLCLACHVP